MKDIKFRAWDIQTKQLIYSDEFNWESNLDRLKCFFAKIATYQDEKWPVMQFTGVLDKKGREIYEGDVVKFSVSETDIIYEVHYFQKIAQFRMQNDKDNSQYFQIDEGFDKCVEVIGNIYENP